MTIFVRVSELLSNNYPTLNICSNNGSPVRVLQWQCCGEISIACSSGVKKEDSLFLNKSRKFIEMALDKNCDLVLTPEYSFPFAVLEEILYNSQQWPQEGQLWCLATQGENRQILSERFKNWREIPGLELINIATDSLEVKSFVSPLIYLFRLNDKKLCVLPQYKTGSMADPRNDFEGPNLCRGQHIFVFDLGDNQCQNVFLSLICADALHIEASNIINTIPERFITIFHPQLNPAPRYSELVNFRKSFYNTGQKDVRFLTLNWATNTLGRYNGRTYTFDIPWSAYFKNSKIAQPLLEQSTRKNKENNHKKGTPFIVSDRIEVWFSDRNEHCKSFIISKGDNSNSRLPVINRDDPTTEGCYLYDETENEWGSVQPYCASNIRNIFDEFNIPLDFPYPICSSDPNSCDKCQKTDYFYGSLFGKFEDHEITSTNEQVSRLLVGADNESDSFRKDKFDMLMHLKNLLIQGQFPNALKYLKNNFVFKISDDFPLQGKNQYNIAPRTPTHPDAEALVVITNEMTISKVEKLVQELIDNMSERYRNQILVYYRTPGNGYIFYDKHLSEKSISKPKYSSDFISIKNVVSTIFNRGGI
jgi:hypothetical protein